jgi:hypothetical protein
MRDLGNQHVDWEIKSPSARDVVLQFGAEQLGTLYITDMSGRTAVATCADGKWTLHVEDMGGNKVSVAMVTAVDQRGNEILSQVGEMTLKRLMSGRLLMAGGRVFQWKVDATSAEWVEDGSNVPYVRLARTGGKTGIVAIAPAQAADSHVPMLALLGVYLTLLVMILSSRR